MYIYHNQHCSWPHYINMCFKNYILDISRKYLKFDIYFSRATHFLISKFWFVTTFYIYFHIMVFSSCCFPILNSHTMICGCKIYDDFCKMSFCRWHNLEQLSGQIFLTFFTSENAATQNYIYCKQHFARSIILLKVSFWKCYKAHFNMFLSASYLLWSCNITKID